jgi:putative NADPH-quinone reductase
VAQLKNMNVLAISSSPRSNANSKALLQSFERGLLASGGNMETVHAQDCKLKPCRGCLRCNLVKRCALLNDDWPVLSKKILAADVLVFAGPIYFHHVASPLKLILDRFRSFMHVRITEQGLVHTPWHEWKKHFVLLLAMGAPTDVDASPVVELFEYMTGVLGPQNRLSVIAATGLALAGQITMDTEQLSQLYLRLGLDPKLSDGGYVRNQNYLKAAEELGRCIWKR